MAKKDEVSQRGQDMRPSPGRTVPSAIRLVMPALRSLL